MESQAEKTFLRIIRRGKEEIKYIETQQTRYQHSSSSRALNNWRLELNKKARNATLKQMRKLEKFRSIYHQLRQKHQANADASRQLVDNFYKFCRVFDKISEYNLNLTKGKYGMAADHSPADNYRKWLTEAGILSTRIEKYSIYP